MGHRILPDGPVFGQTFKPGEYLKDSHTGIWWARPPRGRITSLDMYQVAEHEDETITVTPKIEVGEGANPDTQPGWSGWLRAGRWETT